MQHRERILLIAACGAVAIWLGLPLVERIFVTPINERQAVLTTLDEEFIARSREIVQIKDAGASLQAWRERSLPPDPLDAQRLYQAWLTDLAQISGFSELRVTPGRRIEKAAAYTSSLVSLEGTATLAQLSDFLQKFYGTDLLHRIVSLNLDSPTATGNPQLNFSLIAEGVSLTGTPPREYLYPQTVLKKNFRSSVDPQTIEVGGSSDFPAGKAFRVRLGEELLQVTKCEGSTWTVIGGREGSSPSDHAIGDVVELAPLRLDVGHRSDVDRQQLVEKSPFAKPLPPATAVVRATRPAPKPPPIDRSAEQTYLAASISEDGEPQAWLYREGTLRTVLHRNSTIIVGDFEAIVQDIQPDYVVLDLDKKLWRLRIGRNLRSLEEIPQSEIRLETSDSRQ